MSLNVLAFALSAMLLGFLAFHSLWRFFLRKQLPSLVHAAMPVLVFVYEGAEFQDRTIQTSPSTMAICVVVVGLIATVLVVAFELRQPHPWN